MGIIDPDNEIVNESSCEYWQNELVNTKILLNEIDKAILAITKTNIESYTIDTGQSRQTVTRVNIPALIQQKSSLQNTINSLELKLGVGQPAVKQVIPGF